MEILLQETDVTTVDKLNLDMSALALLLVFAASEETLLQMELKLEMTVILLAVMGAVVHVRSNLVTLETHH